MHGEASYLLNQLLIIGPFEGLEMVKTKGCGRTSGS
jgi:hypothetical protein